MPYKPYAIMDFRAGKITALEPWKLPKDAFRTLRNCHLRLGILEKRRGYSEFGQLIHTNTTTEADVSSSLSVMGIHNYYKANVETLLAMNTERVNKYNTTSALFEDTTRIMIHYKPGTSQDHEPVADDVCEETPSGAYGTVESVVIDHGTHTGGDADGWIIFKNGTITGTFVGGQNLRDKDNVGDIYGDSDGTQFENVFTGEDYDFFWHQNWQDIGYFTNNNDQIYRYFGGKGTSIPFNIDLDVEGGPDNDVYSTLMIFVVKNRLVLLNTTEEDGSHPRRARYSDVNNPAIFRAALYKDAPTEDEIVAADFIGDDLYVFFGRTPFRLAYTGDATEPFEWQKMEGTEGFSATMSLLPFSDEIIGVGPTSVLGFDKRKMYSIDEKIPDFMLEWNQDAIKYCFGLVLDEMRLGYISYTSLTAVPEGKPDSALILNYEDNCFSTYELPIHVLGYSQMESDLILDEIPESVLLDDIDYSFDDKEIQVGYPTTLMGCRDGYVYKLNDGGSDNGAAIAFEAGYADWNPFSQAGLQVQLGWIDFLVDKDVDASFDVEFYVNNEASSYQTKTITCTETGTNKDKVIKRVYSGAVADFHRIVISNNATSNRPVIHATTPYMRSAGRTI